MPELTIRCGGPELKQLLVFKADQRDSRWRIWDTGFAKTRRQPFVNGFTKLINAIRDCFSSFSRLGGTYGQALDLSPDGRETEYGRKDNDKAADPFCTHCGRVSPRDADKGGK